MPRTQNIATLTLLAICCCISQSAAESNLKTNLINAAHQQDEAEILADLQFLASDERKGRDTGSPEILESAQFIHKKFQAAGLKSPQGMPDGFQRFPLSSKAKQGKEVALKAVLEGKEDNLLVDAEFRVCSFGGKGKVTGEVVFCGYGINDAKNNFDEFADVDLKGKIALIMRRVPRQKVHGSLYISKNGKIDTRKAALRAKIQNAQKQGAIAVVLVNDPTSTQGKKDALMAFGYGGSGGPKTVPVFHIKQKKANQLLQAGIGKTLTEIEIAIDEKLEPHSQLLKGVKIEAHADLITNSVEGFNVIGILEPEHADEKTETIVVGAHYDHVGMGGQGSLAPGSKAIHNGADDNASGTTALLELVRRITEKKEKLNRRIVFIAFSAEEKGLIGSKYYVANPLYSLSKTISMLNLDMVGRLADEKLTVFGVGSSSFWKPTLDEIEKSSQLNFFRETKAFGPSDHASFYAKQIPVLHLFTGLHEDYHRPGDDIEEVNVQGIRRTVDVLEYVVSELQKVPQRPDYIENKKWISVGRHAGGRSRLGLIPNLNSPVPGYALLSIVQNSPAHHAGLKTGDVIIEVNETKIETRKDLWKIVDSLKPKTILTINYRRNDEVIKTELKLGNPR